MRFRQVTAKKNNPGTASRPARANPPFHDARERRVRTRSPTRARERDRIIRIASRRASPRARAATRGATARPTTHRGPNPERAAIDHRA